MKWIFAALCLFLSAVPATALAFNSGEHQYVSDEGFFIAFEMQSQGKDLKCADAASADPLCQIKTDVARQTAPDEDTETIIDQLREGVCSSKVTYGTFTCDVDYVLDPNVLLAGHGPQHTYIEDTDGVNPQYARDTWLDKKLSYYRASHTNDAHFQGQLMFNLYDWHQRALNLARTCNKDGTCFTAAIMNALGDHYLQDFFAPGHIKTTRYNTADEVALSIHDDRNLRGEEFSVSQEKWKALAHTLDFIRVHGYGIDPTVMDKLSADVAANQPLKMYGDGYLEDHQEEMLFIMLVEIQSVRELLQCISPSDDLKSTADDKPLKCGETEFDWYSWQPALIGGDLNLVPTESGPKDAGRCYSYDYASYEASIPFGHYQFNCEMSLADFSYAPAIGVSGAAEVLSSSGMDQFRKAAILEIQEPNPTASLGAVDPETLQPSWDSRIVLALSYKWVSAPGLYHAYGTYGRVIYTFPMIDFALSLYGGTMIYSDNTGRSKTNRPYGLRGDMGFSMLTAYFGVGRDYGYLPNGTYARGTLWQFGINIWGPVTRIAGRNGIL